MPRRFSGHVPEVSARTRSYDRAVSNAAYALIGVVVGGAVTAAVQIGVAVVLARRAEKAEWLVASRLVSEELERLATDLQSMIDQGVTPSFPADERFLSTDLWESHRTVIARELPDSDKGDDLWRGLAS